MEQHRRRRDVAKNSKSGDGFGKAPCKPGLSFHASPMELPPIPELAEPFHLLTSAYAGPLV